MHDLLLILHLSGLAAGVGAGIVVAVLFRATSGLAPGDRAGILKPVLRPASLTADAGLGLLILSGLALAAGYGMSGLGGWFWLKMAGVAALIALTGARHMAAARLRRGEPAALATLARLAPFGPVAAGLTIICAVLAFH